MTDDRELDQLQDDSLSPIQAPGSPTAAKEEEAQPSRTRTMMSPHQLEQLQQLWSQAVGNEPINRFPSTFQREQLAAKIGLTPRKVQIWFQNQRQKHRRLELQQQSQQTSASASSQSSSTSSRQLTQPSTATSSYGHHTQTHGSTSHLSQPVGLAVGRPPSSHAPHPLLVPPPLPSVSSLFGNHPPLASHPSPHYPSHPSSATSYRTSAEEAYELARYSHISPPTVIQLRTNPAHARGSTEPGQYEHGRAPTCAVDVSRDQEMGNVSYDPDQRPDDSGRRPWSARAETAPVAGWFDVGIEQRRTSESGPPGSHWSQDGLEHRPIVQRHTSVSSLAGPTASTARLDSHQMGNASFQGMARYPSSHERGSSPRSRSPMDVSHPRRASPSRDGVRPSTRAGDGPSTLPSAIKDSPDTPNVGLPSFRDFLVATSTSTTNAFLPSSLPAGTIALGYGRSSYASSSGSSSHGHPSRSLSLSHSRRPSARGGEETGELALVRSYAGSSAAPASHPHSPTRISSSYGGNRGLTLPPPSPTAFIPTSLAVSPTRSQTSWTSSYNTLRPPTSATRSSISSSAHSAAPSAHSVASTHQPLMTDTLALSSDGSASLSSHSFVLRSAGADATSTGISAMDVDVDDGDGRRPVSSSSSSSRGGGGGVSIPGMLDVVGFGGEVGLGRFAISGSRPRA